MRLLVALFLLLGTWPLMAQEESPNSKAEKYHSVLVKRPSPGYLFDRFFDSWMDSGTVEGLQKFLEAKAAASSSDRLLLAFFYAKLGEDLKSLSEFEAALENDPANAEAWLQKAEAEARMLNFSEALISLGKAENASPKEDVAISIGKLKGQLLVRDGKSEEALATWKELLVKHPDDEELHEDIVEQQINEGLYDEAVATSLELVEKTSDAYMKVVRQLRTGDIYQRAGKREEALDAYSGTLAKVGRDTWMEREVLAQIEDVFRREDNLSGLADYLDELLETEKDRIALRQRRATLLAELGQEEEAIKAWTEVLELTPGDRGIREAYISMLSQLGRDDDAVAQMAALAELYSDDVELIIQLAGLQFGAELKAEAGATLESFLEQSDGSEYSYLRTARLLTEFGLVEKGESVYQQMLAKFPDSVGAKEAYAAFLFEIKKRDEAVAMWKDLANTSDANQAVRVARALAARREHGEAFELLKVRYEELKRSPVFLGQLCEAALQVGKAKEAWPWAKLRVAMAEEPIDLGESVTLAAKVVRKSGQVADYVAELEGKELSIQETCLLAELLDLSGRSQDAEKLLATVEGEDAIFALAQTARSEREKRNWVGAAEAVEKIVKLPEGKKSAYVQELVSLFERAFQPEKALEWLAEWKKLSPGSVSPWLKEAEILTSTGEHGGAVEALRSAAQRFDDSPDIRAKLAEAYYLLGKTPDAERLYWRLYEDTEDSMGKMSWVQQLARIAAETGKIEELVERFEERKRSNRTSIVPVMALAEIYRQQNDNEARRQAILEASRIQPEDVGLLHQLATIDEGVGNYDGAFKSLRAAKEHDATDRTVRRMARLHFSIGEFEQGFALLRSNAGHKKTAGASPGLSEFDELREVYEAIVKRGQWERAVQFLTPHYENNRDDYRIAYLRAVALEESEQPELAREAFLAMLDMEKELPEDPKPSNSSTSNVRGVGVINLNQLQAAANEKSTQEWMSVFPEKAKRLQELQSASNMAYAYRNGRGRGRIYGFSDQRHYSHYQSGYQMVTPSIIGFPTKLEQARSYASAHLTRLAEGDETKIAEVKAAFEVRGLPSEYFTVQGISERLKLESQGLLEPGELGELGKLLIANPDSKTLHAYWLTSYQRGAQSEEIAENARKLFSDSPQILFIIDTVHARWRHADAETRTAAVQRLIETLKSEEVKVPLRSFQNFSYILTVDIAMEQQPDRYTGNGKPFLTPELRKEMLTLFREKIPEYIDEHGEEQLNWTRYTLLQLIAAEGTTEDYIQLLDEIVAEARENPIQSQALQYKQILNYQTQNQVLQSIPFPMMAEEFPMAIFTKFSAFGYSGLNNRDLPDKEDLAASIDEVKDPLLKLLIANYVEDDEMVKALVKQMESTETPSVEQLLMVAGYAAKQEDYQRASASLKQVRNLPISKEVGKVVDSALVDAALKADENTEAREVGKTALQRLYSGGNYQSYQREQLISAMKTLEMEAEVTRSLAATARIQQARNSSRSGARLITNMASPQQLATKLEQMVEKGNEAGAVRLATKQLRQFATDMLSPGRSVSSYELRELKKKLNGAGLVKPILEAAQPAVNAKAVELVQYAAISDLLGESETAIAAYSEILEKRPQDDSLRMRIILLHAVEDPKKALEHLAIIQDAGNIQFLQQSLQEVSSNAQTFNEKFNLGELAVEFLKSQDPESSSGLLKNSYWLSQIRSNLTQQIYADEMYLPDLYELAPSRNYTSYSGYTEEKFNRYQKQRLELIGRLSDIMMKFPSLAALGFSDYAAIAMGKHERLGDDQNVKAAASDSEAVLKKASEVLTRLEKPAFIGNDYQFTGYSGSYSSGGDANKVTIRGPIEFITWYAFVNDKKSVIYEELLPSLREEDDEENSSESVAAALESWSDLYFKDGSEFGGVLEKLAENQSLRNGVYLAAATKVWALRKLDFDMQGVVLKKTKEQIKSNGSPNQSVIVAYARALIERGEIDQLPAFLDELQEAYLGPKDKQRELVEKHFNPNSWGGNTPNTRIQYFRQLASEMAEIEPALIFPMIGRLDEVGILRTDSYHNFFNYFETQNWWEENPEKGIRLIENSPLVKEELADFRPIETQGIRNFSNNNQKTLLGQLLNTIGKMSVEKSKPYVAWCEQRKKKTFGTDLLEVAVTIPNTKVAEPYLKLFARETDAINALSEDQRSQIGLMATELITSGFSSKGESLSSTLNFLREIAGEGAEDELKRITAAKDLKDLKMREYQFDDFLEALVGQSLEKDLAAGLKSFREGVALVDRSIKRNAWNYSYSDRTFSGYVLYEVATEDRIDGVKRLEFLLSVVASEEIPGSEIRTWSMFRDIASGVGKSIRAKKTEEEKLAEAQRVITEQIAEVCADSPAKSLLIPFFHQFLRNSLPSSSMDDMLEWATAQRTSENTKLAAVALELETAASIRVAQTEEIADGATRLMPEAVMSRLVTLMQDESQPIEARVSMAQVAVDSGMPKITDDVTVVAAGVLASAWDSESSVYDDEVGETILDFLRVSKETRESERWHTISSNIASGFQKLFIAGSAPQRLPSKPDADILEPMLALQIERGEIGAANLILSRFEDRFSDLTTAFLLLVKSQEFDSAQRLLRRSRTKLGGRYSSNVIPWGDELEQALPKFLDTIKVNDYQYLAEVLVASAANPKETKSNDAKQTPRDERLIKVAGKFADVEFAQDSLRLDVLSLLAQNRWSAVVVSDHILEAANEVNLLSHLDSSGSRGINWQRNDRIIKAHANLALSVGKFDEFLQFVDKTNKLDLSSSYNRGYFLDKALVEPMKYLKSQDYDPKVAEKLLPVFQEIARKDDWSLRSTKRETLLAHYFFIASYLGKFDHFSEFRKSPTGENKRYKIAEPFYKTAATILKDKPLIEKVAWIDGLMDERFFEESMVNFSTAVFRDLKKYKVLNQADLDQEGPGIATRSSRNGYAWAELGMMYDQRQKSMPEQLLKNRETALGYYEKAIEEAKAGTLQNALRFFEFKQARVLAWLDRKDQAQAILDKYPEADVPKFQKNSRKDVVNALK